MTEEEILKRMCKMADALDFMLSGNALKIAKIKSRMDNPRRCPCCPNDPEMYCGSMKCEEETRKNKRCHCGCFLSIPDDSCK